MEWIKSFLGFGAVICGLVGLFFFGFIPSLSWLSPYLLSIAAGLTVAALVLSRRSLWKFLARRSTRYGANSLLIVFLVLGILTFINILAREYNWRKDITKLASNTLSEQSRKIARELTQDVHIIYLAGDDQKDSAEQVLKRYTYESKRIHYEILNPNRAPTRAKALGLEKIENDVAILLLGDKNNPAKKVIIQGLGEEKLTNGLVKLLKSKDQVIGFIVGHGEKTPEAPEGSPDSLLVFKQELEKEAYGTKLVQLVTLGQVPAEVSVLVILGSRTAFFPKELEILKSWIQKGGRVLFAADLDPRAQGLSLGSRQIAQILREYGVVIGSSLLVDPASKMANVEPQVLMAYSGSKEHPITKDFAVSPLVANFLIPLSGRLQKEPKEGIDYTVLAKTTGNAWEESDWGSVARGAVTFDQSKDVRGELDLAYAVDKKDGPRFVVFNTSYLATDSTIQHGSNRDLLLNSIAWLTDNAEFISIRPPDSEANERVQLDANLLGIIRLVVVIFLPFATIIAGVWVWFRRRNK